MNICSLDTAGLLKNKAVSLNLPLMRRKWDRVDVERKGQKKLRRENVDEAHRLKNEGVATEDIAEKMGLTPKTISRYFKYPDRDPRSEKLLTIEN